MTQQPTVSPTQFFAPGRAEAEQRLAKYMGQWVREEVELLWTPGGSTTQHEFRGAISNHTFIEAFARATTLTSAAMHLFDEIFHTLSQHRLAQRPLGKEEYAVVWRILPEFAPSRSLSIEWRGYARAVLVPVEELASV